MPSPETLREGMQTLLVLGCLGGQIYLRRQVQELKKQAHTHEEEGVSAEEPAGEGEEVPKGQKIPEPAPA